MLLSDRPVTLLPSRKSRFCLFPLFDALRFQKATFETGWMASRTSATFWNQPGNGSCGNRAATGPRERFRLQQERFVAGFSMVPVMFSDPLIKQNASSSVVNVLITWMRCRNARPLSLSRRVRTGMKPSFLAPLHSCANTRGGCWDVSHGGSTPSCSPEAEKHSNKQHLTAFSLCIGTQTRINARVYGHTSGIGLAEMLIEVI